MLSLLYYKNLLHDNYPNKGGYLDFAFHRVVLQKEDPETVLKQTAKESTLEIQKKLKEFARFINKL